MSNHKRVKWTDKKGIKRLSLLPRDAVDPSEGIPLDIYDIILESYKESPVETVKQLCDALWARGIITPNDLQKKGALKLIKQAIQSACKFDANRIMSTFEESQK